MEVPADGGAASLVAASQSYWPSRDYSALDSFTVNGAGLYIATEIPQDYGTSVDGQLLDAGVLFGEFLSPENGAGLVSSVLLASNASDLVGAFCIGPYSGEPPLAELAVTSADAGEAVLLKGWDSPCPTSMALDANNAYLTFGNGVPVMEVSLEDGGVTALAASPNAHGIAVDDAHVYWTDLDAGAVMRVEVDGGATAVVASGLSFPTEIVVDQTSVYVQDLAGVRKVTPK